MLGGVVLSQPSLNDLSHRIELSGQSPAVAGPTYSATVLGVTHPSRYPHASKSRSCRIADDEIANSSHHQSDLVDGVRVVVAMCCVVPESLPGCDALVVDA